MILDKLFIYTLIYPLLSHLSIVADFSIQESEAEESGIQDQLHNKFKVNLGYMRPCCRKEEKRGEEIRKRRAKNGEGKGERKLKEKESFSSFKLCLPHRIVVIMKTENIY